MTIDFLICYRKNNGNLRFNYWFVRQDHLHVCHILSTFSHLLSAKSSLTENHSSVVKLHKFIYIGYAILVSYNSILSIRFVDVFISNFFFFRLSLSFCVKFEQITCLHILLFESNKTSIDRMCSAISVIDSTHKTEWHWIPCTGHARKMWRLPLS